MLIKWGNGLLYVGRNYCSDLDVEIFLGWHPRTHRKPHQLIFHRSISLSWNWLPQFCWEWQGGVYALNSKKLSFSQTWTGRRRMISRVYWPVSFRNVRIP
jgi:hypothetical protein